MAGMLTGGNKNGKYQDITINDFNDINTRDIMQRRILDNNTTIEDEFETDIFKSNGYASGSLKLLLNQKANIIVKLNNYRYLGNGDYRKLHEVIIYRSSERAFYHNVSYDLDSVYYSLTIVNLDIGNRTINSDSYEILNDNYKEKNYAQRVLFEHSITNFNRGTSVETDIYPTDGLNYASLKVDLLLNRKINIYVKYLFQRPDTFEYVSDDYQLVYTSKNDKTTHFVNVQLKSDFVMFKIENADIVGTTLSSTSKVTMFFNPNIDKHDDSKLLDKVDKMAGGHVDTNIKHPDRDLIFKESPIKAKLMARGYDNLFYVIDSDNKLKTYEDLTKDEMKEEGITWDASTYGSASRIIAFPDGIAVFSELDSQATIHHLDDINSTPKLVYQSDTFKRSRWSNNNAFGIKSYYNGLGSYVLAGVYGTGAESRDLLLSKDGGRSFDVVKQSSNTDEEWNSHWHDVAFDVYGGLLWAAEGDEVDGNQNVFYSDDFGESWTQLDPLTRNQPTAIMPFADKVVFGRDSKLPGLDVWKRSQTSQEFANSEIETLKEFKINTLAFKYYAHSPIVSGKEAYFTFSLYSEETPKMIMATGDGGSSWHSVFVGDNSIGLTIESLAAIDDDYVYAYGNTSNIIYYAEKIRWL